MYVFVSLDKVLMYTGCIYNIGLNCLSYISINNAFFASLKKINYFTGYWVDLGEYIYDKKFVNKFGCIFK